MQHITESFIVFNQLMSSGNNLFAGVAFTFVLAVIWYLFVGVMVDLSGKSDIQTDSVPCSLVNLWCGGVFNLCVWYGSDWQTAINGMIEVVLYTWVFIVCAVYIFIRSKMKYHSALYNGNVKIESIDMLHIVTWVAFPVLPIVISIAQSIAWLGGMIGLLVGKIERRINVSVTQTQPSTPPHNEQYERFIGRGGSGRSMY